MEQKTLAASPRQHYGSSESRRLRRSGKIPAILYGRQAAPTGLIIDAHEFNSKFSSISESTIIDLKVDGQSYDVLIRDYQEDVVKGVVTHVDFYQIERGKTLRTNVSVQLSGAPVGVREGGLLETFVHEVEVECLPKDLPESIGVEISGLAIGDSIHVREIGVPDGVRVLNPPEQVVCAVAHKRVEEEAEAAEELEAEAAEAEAEEGEAAEERSEE